MNLVYELERSKGATGHKTTPSQPVSRMFALSMLAMIASTAFAAPPHPPKELPLPPVTSKVFVPASVAVGGTTQMTVTITNPNAGTMSGVHVADIYPGGIVSAAANPIVTNNCAGVIDAAAGGSEAMLNDAVLPANGVCSFTINVVGTASGMVVNNTGPVTSSNAPTGMGATATLAVTATSLINKPYAWVTFSPNQISVNGTSQLNIQIVQPPNNIADMTGLQFNDVYPPGLVNAPGEPIVFSGCGGQVTAEPNGNSVSLANGYLPAWAVCNVTVNVVGTTAGAILDESGDILSANAEPGSSAQAALTVTP